MKLDDFFFFLSLISSFKFTTESEKFVIKSMTKLVLYFLEA